ncbi:MAG TPA: hypothetical protein VMT59_14300 [Gaiellaceae bacterium]|nr:hypothetical protein [Gaiellaceae bacterium]
MSEPDEAYELLRKLNPVQPDELDVSEVALHATLAKARGSRLPVFVRQSALRTGFRVLAVAAAVGSAVAVVVLVLPGGGSSRIAVRCYTSASLQAQSRAIHARRGAIISACRAELQTTAPSRSQLSVPLQVCVLRSGVLAVFPSPDNSVCAHLNLRAFPSERQP